MQRKASAAWQGGLRDGQGSLTTDSGVLSATPYSFGTRFEGAAGTNPEELIAAAHAGCFSMALSMMLGEAGIRPDRSASRRESKRARRRPREIRGRGGQGQGRMPGQQGVERRDYDGCETRRLNGACE